MQDLAGPKTTAGQSDRLVGQDGRDIPDTIHRSIKFVSDMPTIGQQVLFTRSSGYYATRCSRETGESTRQNWLGKKV